MKEFIYKHAKIISWVIISTITAINLYVAYTIWITM